MLYEVICIGDGVIYPETKGAYPNTFKVTVHETDVIDLSGKLETVVADSLTYYCDAETASRVAIYPIHSGMRHHKLEVVKVPAPEPWYQQQAKRGKRKWKTH